MSAIYRRTSKGDVEVKITKDDSPVLINKGFRIANEHKVEIAHYLHQMSRSAYYLIHRPMLMMNYLDTGEENVFSTLDPTGDSDGCTEPRWAMFPGTIIMQVRYIDGDPHVYVTDTQKRSLAGSNVYDGDNLCLGESINPFNFQPVEAFLENEANDDLGWRGDSLGGSWKENGADSYFEITSWPHISRPRTEIPDALIGDIALWWPT